MPQNLNDEFDIQLDRRTPPGARQVNKNPEEIARNISHDTFTEDSSYGMPDAKPLRETDSYQEPKPRRQRVHDEESPRESKSENTESRRRHSQVQATPPALIRFFTDRRLHIFFATLCLLVGIVMLVILVSHLRNGGNDQSRAANLTVEQIAVNSAPVNNAGGAIGAKLSHLLFTEALGLGSLMIALYIIIMGITIINRRRLEFWSLTFKSLLLAITFSIVPGLVCFTAGTEINWGGTHGHFVNETLMRLGGPIFAISLSCCLIAAVVCIYLNDIIRLYNIWHERRRTIAEAMPRIKKNKKPLSIEDKPIVEPTDVETCPPQKHGNPSQEPVEPIDSVAPVNPIDVVTAPDEDSRLTTNPQQTTATDNNTTDNGFTIDDNAGDGFKVETPQADVLDDGKAIMDNTPYDHRAGLSRYSFPPLSLLNEVPLRTTVDIYEQQENKERIIKALADHKVFVSSITATVGPTVTLFEIIPTEGTRIAQIKRLEDDIAMTLKARGIRIIAPMPGKGTVGIEVPNNDPQTVSMRSVLASTKFRECKKALPVALGATVSNDIFVTDLASMPHVLVAGATGQGKSVGLNCIIASLLYKKHPTELKFVLIDPKEVEFSLYSKLCNHYLACIPGVDEESGIITRSENVLLALNSLCVLMDQRYALLRKAGVRNIVEYNEKFTNHKLNPENGHDFMPYIVVIIDEFADLIMTAGKEIETPVTRITQKARAVGIHMVIATQRPSTNVLTGLIKANCPTRIAFRVMQMVDSRTILDRPGANQLIGRGDMLYSSGGEIERMQCAFIDTEEVERLCAFVGEQIGFEKPYYLPEPKFNNDEAIIGGSHATAAGVERDPLFDEAAHFIITQSAASVSSLQRRYQIGYNRAGKIMDQMEAAGIVGAAVGSKPRPILVDGPTLDLILENRPY